MFDSAALAPTAVHLSPVVVASNELYPTAVLEDAVVFAFNDREP